jgi:hypothetical protein
LASWTQAASAAASAGVAINVALHVTWGALLHGDKREGHVLGLAPSEREKRLWAALRLCAARHGVPWVAARAPEYDKTRGLHLHVVLHLPDTRAIRDALEVVEKLTGAPAEWSDMRGCSIRGFGRMHHGVVARSACGGWFMQRHVETAGGNGLRIAGYAAKGDGKAAVDGQHRLSNALTSLARHAASLRASRSGL